VLAENVSLIKDHGADFLQLENDLGILEEEAIEILKKVKTFTQITNLTLHLKLKTGP
jgi:acyl-CoA oxidase